jgi:hypothetical protein
MMAQAGIDSASIVEVYMKPQLKAAQPHHEEAGRFPDTKGEQRCLTSVAAGGFEPPTCGL